MTTDRLEGSGVPAYCQECIEPCISTKRMSAVGFYIAYVATDNTRLTRNRLHDIDDTSWQAAPGGWRVRD